MITVLMWALRVIASGACDGRVRHNSSSIVCPYHSAHKHVNMFHCPLAHLLIGGAQLGPDSSISFSFSHQRGRKSLICLRPVPSSCPSPIGRAYHLVERCSTSDVLYDSPRQSWRCRTCQRSRMQPPDEGAFLWDCINARTPRFPRHSLFASSLFCPQGKGAFVATKNAECPEVTSTGTLTVGAPCLFRSTPSGLITALLVATAVVIAEGIILATSASRVSSYGAVVAIIITPVAVITLLVG